MIFHTSHLLSKSVCHEAELRHILFFPLPIQPRSRQSPFFLFHQNYNESIWWPKYLSKPNKKNESFPEQGLSHSKILIPSTVSLFQHQIQDSEFDSALAKPSAMCLSSLKSNLL